jgi:hypothetical protein
MDQFATSASSYALDTLKTRVATLFARFDELATNKDLRATLRTEGY